MIYCDESLSKGTYYSHFYGGVLVKSKDFYWDISEIDSRKHPIQQCMDIVLGAMAFHMNRMHLATPDGNSSAPGKKTLAKEELF